jgi:GNAT superfamily N-acetyltransferase
MRAITVREATLDDAPTIARLSGELGYPANPADVAARIKALTDDPTQCVRVAVGADGAVMGWAHAAQQLLLESGARCELLGLVTAAEARGTGVGRALVESIETWARQARLPLVSLRCNVVRTAAHGFYEHLGYQKRKTQHAFRKPLVAEAETWPMA